MGSDSKLILISAMTRLRVIGKDRALPWNIPEEYEHFLGGRQLFREVAG